MGTGRAVNRSFSGQCLHGHQSNRGRRGFHCACTQVGTPALATDPGLVATLVYPASSIVPLNARSRTIPVTPAGGTLCRLVYLLALASFKLIGIFANRLTDRLI